MSIKDYLDTIAPTATWLKQSWQSAKRTGVSKLSMRDIDSEIRRYRRERVRVAEVGDPACARHQRRGFSDAQFLGDRS
jgi:hypothetical protein